MGTVTIVIVYQDSMPWLDLCLESLRQFKNNTPLQYVFVENLPHNDNGHLSVDRFIAEHPAVAKKLTTTPPPCNDGRAHEHGLNLAYEAIATEWTLFLDADCIPVADGWLDTMMSYNVDMIGPVPDSGIGDYSLPLLHACMLLFRTAIAKPPYWNKFFGRWNRNQTVDHSDWDTCRPFSYAIGTNPDLKQVRLGNTFSRHANGVYFSIHESGKQNAPIAIHIREGSKALLRHPHGDGRETVLATLPYFSWYKKQIPPPYDYHLLKR